MSSEDQSINSEQLYAKCPFCKEEILIDAIKCKHCSSLLIRKKLLRNKKLLISFFTIISIPIFLISCTTTRQYYPNNILKGEIPHFLFLKHGTVKHYNNQGLINSEINYKLNIKDGKSTFYYNGHRTREYPYKWGVQNGIYKTYSYSNPDILWSEVPLKYGKKNGILKEYDYQTGILSRETPYKNGKINGVVIGYDSDSRVDFKVEYKDDMRNGFERSYYPNGQLEKEAKYKNDNLVGDIKAYDKNGKSIKYEPMNYYLYY